MAVSNAPMNAREKTRFILMGREDGKDLWGKQQVSRAYAIVILV